MSAANGSSPRLDRIEKIIEQGELRNQKAHARFEKSHARLEKSHVRLESDLRRFESNLRRWGALGVKEARNQRRRSAEVDRKFEKKMDQLASAQLVTEEGLQQLKEALRTFIASAGRGRNGH